MKHRQWEREQSHISRVIYQNGHRNREHKIYIYTDRHALIEA